MVDQSAAERLDKDGFVILEHVFERSFIDSLRAEYERQYPDVATAPDAYSVGERRIQVSMQLKGPFLSADLYANPALLGLVEQALGADFTIDNFSLVTALPGAADQHLHTDHPDLFPDHIFSRAVIRPYALSIAIPLVDLSPETGTTKLFPGSHNRYWNENDFVLPYLSRGSCYVVDYRLSHRGTANHGISERPIIYLVFARPWFTDTVNYGNNVRINITREDLKLIAGEHRPLFRRLAAKGAFDQTVNDLLSAQQA